MSDTPPAFFSYLPYRTMLVVFECFIWLLKNFIYFESHLTIIANYFRFLMFVCLLHSFLLSIMILTDFWKLLVLYKWIYTTVYTINVSSCIAHWFKKKRCHCCDLNSAKIMQLWCDAHFDRWLDLMSNDVKFIETMWNYRKKCIWKI